MTFVDVHCHGLPNLGDGPASLGEAAWELATSGPRVRIATDAHDDLQAGGMTRACGALASRRGEDLARLLYVENPGRVVRGQGPVSVRARSRPAAS
jgi:hypothetical protein